MAEDDRGASGASFELEKLGQILELADKHEFDVLIVREMDRLSRNLAKQLIVEEELLRAGVKIEYVLGDYAETPEGNLMKHVRAVIAEYEREKIKERIQHGKRLKVKAGSVKLAPTEKDGLAFQTQLPILIDIKNGLRGRAKGPWFRKAIEGSSRKCCLRLGIGYVAELLKNAPPRVRGAP